LGGLILLFVFNPTGHCFKDNTQILTLKHKKTEISDLHAELSQKIVLIIKMRRELNTRLQTFIEEIIQEAKGRKISSYNEAIKIPRIHYNLKLIQKLEGYMTALRHKIAYLKDANEQLEFYYQQIEDDLRIIETLREMDIGELIGSIDQALDAYAPETQKHIIYADRIAFHPPQKLWRQIMAEM
jgi:hypothetical protein